MGRIPYLLGAAILLAAVAGANAQEVGTREKPRMVAHGITMSPGAVRPVPAKKSEPAPVETSKTAQTAYGPPVSPSPPLEARLEQPQPTKAAVTVMAKNEPAPQALAREQVRNAPPSNTARIVREPKVGDRIPDDVKLSPAQPVRVGDRVPDGVPLYELPRSAAR